MAEAAAISLATDAATGIGQVLMGRTIEEMKLVWGLKDDLEKLKTKYSKLQRFLKDVESAKDADKRRQVNDWVVKVKDAAYVADDIIDDYDYEVIRREREKKKEFHAFFRRKNNPVLFRIRMSHRVRDALASFDELDKDARDMGLRQVEITKDGIAGPSSNNDQGSGDRLNQARQEAAANATEFVGREDEMKKLIEIMCSPSNDQEGDISAVAILGLGGLGKTTFARCLYNSKDIETHFGKKFWISVSDNFTTLRILNEMLEYVTSSKGNLSNIDAIINKLQENLKNQKYLLVLDDVWCKGQDVWSSLKNALQRIGGLPGCLILITTRLIEVTTRSRAETHLLRELSEEAGWALLKQRVLEGGTSPNFSILEESGKKIVAKCQGVPLAIKAIGGILQSKQLPSDWELIEKSEIWDLPQNDENQILPSLRLTFDHLPSPAMKQCFAYCAAFCPRGYTMEKDELVDIWLAQGFLYGSEIKNLTMEEIGEKYLMVLLNYSLLDEVKGGALRYKMHDLVYDLAVDVSGKDLLFSKTTDHQKINSCRHLVINKKDVEALSNLPITKTLRKLRTICNGLPHNVLAHAKYLRTLAVDDCDIKELPSSIGLLKHLRFLSLSNNPIETLPDSIGKLYLLQTVRLLKCSRMRVLPAILYKLTNLIHVPTTTQMLASWGLLELTNLHTLPRLELRDDADGWSIDELGVLHKLMGEIHISGLESVKTKENARKADLAGKAKVSNVTLAWAEQREVISSGSHDEDVLDGFQPHPNIISLELQNFFGLTFPSWMVRMAVVSEDGSSPSLLQNLTSLKLLNCSRCQMLPTLGHLPCLKYLVLSGLKVESIGNDFYGVPLNESNGSFPSLLELQIFEFESLKTWVLPSRGEETIVFPRLEVIKLRKCPELETIPPLDYFQSLKKVKLSNVGIQSLDITKHKTTSMLSPEVNLKLETLEIDECEKLLSLPSELQYITSLKTMILTNCPALASLPNNIPTNLEKRTSLATFTIEGLTPDFSNSSVNHVSFPSLIELEISNCGALKTCVVPPSADATNVFPHLEVLQVANCPELETLPTLNFQSLKKVGLENLGIRSFSIASPTVNMKLEELRIDGCKKLVSLPRGLQFVASLKTLDVYDCPALTSLPNDLFHGLASLNELSISSCEALSNIPTSLEKCASLTWLGIKYCPSIKGPMPDFSKLKRLQRMIKRGNAIELMISMLKAVEHLPNLIYLATGKFKDEVEQEMYFCDVTPIQRSQSLTRLFLLGNPNIKSLPEQLQLLTQITDLYIQDFDDLEELPEWVGRLSSLETLSLGFCKNLKEIPSKEVFLQMARLRTLYIDWCPFLAESCVKDVGSDWTKISHIPFTHIR